MRIQLNARTPDDVKTYFERTNDPDIDRMLPRSVFTQEAAMANYNASLLPGATSFGRTIYVDGRYVGDIWIYCIDASAQPQCMLSFCIFDKSCWGRGRPPRTRWTCSCSRSPHRYPLINSVGAFTYDHNRASRRVLEKNSFALADSFEEGGVPSCYYERKSLTVKASAIRAPRRGEHVPPPPLSRFSDAESNFYSNKRDIHPEVCYA